MQKCYKNTFLYVIRLDLREAWLKWLAFFMMSNLVKVFRYFFQIMYNKDGF